MDIEDIISAKEATEIANSSSGNLNEYIRFIEGKIKIAALNGEFNVVIKELPYARWFYEANFRNGRFEDLNAEKAITLFRERGFKVEEYYKESQFVDMGLKIKWGK
ncbi:TPA: hypothetical protein QB333_001743 [Pasteurella multocida]|nr:hypothetical protein [Pasteurella multocida]HDR1065097.1 hypothetical protein [Pasteurella multocida]